MSNTFSPLVSPQIIEEVTQWAIMNGVAFRETNNTAKHCPFTMTPMTMSVEGFNRLTEVTSIIAKLINNVSEDHDFLQTSLGDMANAEPFFKRLLSLHLEIHGDVISRLTPARKPLLIMRTDFMEDKIVGAKVVEFNGIAAGMAPFGQRASELHAYIASQWPDTYRDWLGEGESIPADNNSLVQLAYAISQAAQNIKESFDLEKEKQPTFLMVIQENEDNVYDQHLLELALHRYGIRTVRRTFKQLSTQLATGPNQRLILEGVGSVDVVYLRAGYQFSDYYSAEQHDAICCQTLSQTRLFIEQHHVAVNATLSQQLATSKTMQMLLTLMPAKEYARWGLTLDEANQVKRVLAQMKAINTETIHWFKNQAVKSSWVLKNQGEGGGHCIFDDEISDKLSQLSPKEYDAWALMQRLYPQERDVPTLTIRDSVASQVDNLISEIGMFSVHYDGKPATEINGYAGYLIRSKPSGENEGGIHSGQGVLDSLLLRK